MGTRRPSKTCGKKSKYIRQTGCSGNRFWTDVLFHNKGTLSEGGLSSFSTDFNPDHFNVFCSNFSPIELIMDQFEEYSLETEETIWVKFIPTSSGYLDFFLFADGLYSIDNDPDNYISYLSNRIVEIDIGNQSYVYQAGQGPDQQGRETWFRFLDYLYQAGETYYLTFTVPFTGNYGLYLTID